MHQYEWILFDLDETLLRFNTYDALEMLFKHFNTPFTDTDFIRYEEKNRKLWHQYQNRKITIAQLQNDRFSELSKRFHTPTLTLNQLFLDAVSHVTTPLDGAVELLHNLKKKKKLGIITNGFTEMQKKRLMNNDMHHHFDFMITSEQVGIPKPQPGIFQHAFEKMQHPAKEKILMIGDSLDSDILGGINTGIHTCWLNQHKKPRKGNIIPHIEINTLRELTEMFPR